MDLKEYEHFADACFRDTQPPCSSVCPFGLDVREFIKFMQRGNYKGAYRLYQKTVLFPQIVSSLCPAPCAKTCIRARADRGVDLKDLENTCIGKAGSLQPTRYSRMKKEKSVAVIGGGLAGLSCAHRLSSWGYPVTVYEKQDRIGGSALMDMDSGICAKELQREFSILDVKFITGREIFSLEEISADAVFVATGAGGGDFGRPEGVYFGGKLLGAGHMEAINHGLQAARAIDNAFRSGKKEPFAPVSCTAEPDERYYALPYDYAAQDALEVKGEAEAARCFQCNCHQCYDVCPVMQKGKQFPRRMCSEVIVTLKPNMSVRTGVRLINSCTYCGKCAEVCPTGVDMGQCLEFARKDFYDSGAMAPAFHDYWLQDLQFSLSEEAFLLQKEKEDMPSDVLFFPGCQLGASDPRYVIGAYEMIKKQAENPSLLLGCCGLPARWAGQEQWQKEIAGSLRENWERLGRPPVVTACTSCLANLSREIPEMEVTSLYTYLDEHPGCLPEIPAAGGAVQVLDPCASAKDPGTQKSVRSLLERRGVEVLTPEANTGCCGFGGHMYAVDPELFGTFADRRTQDVSGSAVTYCANCRDIFAARGTGCSHILDLILGLEDGGRTPPELELRRTNRRELKYHYTKQEQPMTEPIYPLTIPQEILNKMNEQMLLRSQVETVVRDSEASGNKVLDPEKGLYYGHGRFGTVTIWAAWKSGGSGAVLCNVYSHRVVVKEEP